MKKIFYYLAVLLVIVLASCGTAKKLPVTKKPEKEVVNTSPENPVIPFNISYIARMNVPDVQIKTTQFYNSQEITLTASLKSSSVEVVAGRMVSYDSTTNFVKKIPRMTLGRCIGINKSGNTVTALLISFSTTDPVYQQWYKLKPGGGFQLDGGSGEKLTRLGQEYRVNSAGYPAQLNELLFGYDQTKFTQNLTDKAAGDPVH